MADDTEPYKAPSAEDYFSDNTQGRQESRYVQESGASSKTVKARRRPEAIKRNSSFGNRFLEAARRITAAEFDAQLDRLNIPRPDHELDIRPVLRDGIFPYIGELLRQLGRGEWALRPRTFCILRILGCPELMDSFVDLKRTDAFLPYSDRNLPATIKGTDVRARFLRLQELVLSNQNLEDLEKEGGAHLSFHTSADDYFSQIRLLGQGGTGKVDHVWGSFTLKHFARKRIDRGRSALLDQKKLKIFLNELKILKTASHRHLVKLVSSYTDPTFVVVIMRPVADEDLKSYLQRQLKSDVDHTARKQCIRTFYGCLTKALEYLHHRRIEHKDIKPQNVLVKAGDVFLTDFGTAKAYGESSRSISTGLVSEWTPRYGAPEIANQEPHGKPSDIWSMGCVFLEMATVMNDRSLDEMEQFYLKEGSGVRNFYSNMEATAAWIMDLKSDDSSVDVAPLAWIAEMMQAQPTARPSASQVVAMINDATTEERYFCFSCLEVESSDAHQPSEMVTGSLLRDLQKQHAFHDDHNDSEDTVTAQELERLGAVTVVSQVDSIDEDLAEHEDPAGEVILKAVDITEDMDIHEARTKSQQNPQVRIDHTKLCALEASHPEKPLRKPAPKSPEALRPAISSQSRPRSEVARSEKQVSFVHVTPSSKNEKQSANGARVERFSGLRSDRRPLPTDPEPTNVSIDNEPIVVADPLKPPSLDLKDSRMLPNATLVPSYVLAGSNRFSMEEIRASDPTMGSFNLFVYGRLMFPSALRGFAAHSTKGVYSSLHQRRLVPSSQDWSKANVSIKHAAETMTPASLTGFDVWRPSGYDFAAIQESSSTGAILAARDLRKLAPIQSKSAGEVKGFLLLGLTEEALRYCDLAFCSNHRTLRRARAATGENKRANQEEPSTAREAPLFERRRVAVNIQLTSGQIRSVPAFTYVWKLGIERLWHPWRPEGFVRSNDFQQISSVEPQQWTEEESIIAKTMKINYALVGDELCAAVLAEDLLRLEELLKDDADSDAKCRKYGTPLQAAVVKGNEDMVRLLIEHGASPSKGGGQYGTPLIAATMGSRKAITRLLLKKRADIFATDSQHVNAMYQAVGHGDWAITEMLLEAGAWLSPDYGEIKDLAYERRDKELQALLRDYDIRNAHSARLEASESADTIEEGGTRSSRRLVRVSSQVLKLVLSKFLVLASEPGSWRGRKGVAVTRAALSAGAPPMILDHIRTALDPVSKLIDLLREADQQRENEMVDAQHRECKIEELELDNNDKELNRA